jgi:hypothetical protein
VAASGAVVAVWRLGATSSWTAGDLWAWVLLTLGIAVVEQFPIRLSFRTERISFSLTEAVWIGALMTARPSVVTLAVGAGILLGHAVRGKPLPKLLFNVGQYLLAVTAAIAVYGTFGAAQAPGPKVWAASAAATAVYAVVNAGLVALVVSLVERVSFVSVIGPPLATNALHYAGNTAIALATTAMWVTSRLALPVAVVLMVLAYGAYLSRLESVQRYRLAAVPGGLSSRSSRMPVGHLH